MSERERWIVYPLLMFALGAAVRDKLMQRVESKEIRCESLQIVDHQDPDKTLAQLGFKRAINNDPTQLADRVGTLQLLDSDGQQVCNIATDVMVGRLVARQLLVIDPQFKPLVIAATEPQPALSLEQGGGAVSYQGVIYLNNQRLGVRLAPPANQPQANKPQTPPSPANPAEQESAPAAENAE
jgi:hypothetical protein